MSYVEACSDYVCGSCRRPPTRTAAVKIVQIFVEDEGSSESPSLSFCGDMGIRTSSNNISTPTKHRQTHARSPDEERRKQPTARPAREELPLMRSPRTAVASSKYCSIGPGGKAFAFVFVFDFNNRGVQV